MNAKFEKSDVSIARMKSPKSKWSILFSPFFIICFLVAGSIIGYEVFKNSRSSTSPSDVAPVGRVKASTPDGEELKPVVTPRREKPPEWSGIVKREAKVAPNPSAVMPSAPISAEAAAATRAAQQIIGSLTQVDLSRGELNAEQAQELNQGLKQLVQHGAAAVPAIREFLERNLDLSFDDVKGGKAVGYASLRTGLLDALQQISGPEAIEVSLQALQTTADPREVAILSQNLEQQAPGQYRQETLKAIRETLEQAAKGELGRRDVGPLFQVLQTLGDPAVVSDAQRNLQQWGYYETMTLAGLRDGEGVPALIGMVKDPSIAGTANGNFALQMLAQIAPMYPDAAEALLEQARANQLSERAWRQIATGLAGDQYQFVKQLADGSLPVQNLSGLKGFHIESGNQNFYSTPGASTWTADEIKDRRALIDQLLAVNYNPAKAEALKTARASLPIGTPQK